MNRRKCIKNLGVLGGISISPLSSFFTLEQPTFKMGYQLFSIRDEMAKDPIATLKALKAMGYQDFEIYGFDVLVD